MKAEINKSIEAAIEKHEYGVSSSIDSDWRSYIPVVGTSNKSERNLNLVIVYLLNKNPKPTF